MKKLTFFIAGIFVALAMQAQLPTNWIGDTDIEPFQEAATVYEGSFSCGIIVNTDVQANCDFINTVEIPVIAGESYKISFQGYTSEFVRGRTVFTWTGAAVTYSTGYLGPNTGTWTNFVSEGVVPTGATAVKVGIRFYDVAGFTPGEVQYLDAFTFESPTGTPHTVANGDFELWPGLDPEPTNYPTDFAGEAVGLGAALSWADATGAQLPAGYLIKASTEDNISLPEDGIYVPNDLDFSDGTGAANVAFGEEGFLFPNLEASSTYYFKIFPYSNSGANVDYKTDGTPPSTQVETADIVTINSENFDVSFGEWTTISVVGDQVWSNNNTYGIGGTPCASMSGYQGAPFDNEDWLISPSLTLADYNNETLLFYSAYAYTGPFIELLVSSDYDGSGNPNDFTWDDITDQAQWPPEGSYFEWTASGNLDLSVYTDQAIYVAFKFTSTTEGSATWEIDDIVITGEGEYTPNPEPTNYPDDFAANAQGQSISVNWTDAVGEQLPAGYLVWASDATFVEVPVDGSPIENDPDLSDGSAVLNIAFGLEACAFGNLAANQTYYFAIFPYTNSGNNINYKTDGTFPTTEATTVEVSYLLFTDFNDDWGGWTPISVIGDQAWSRDNTFGLESTPCALMSGYAGGNFENEDWLISPALDFSGSTNEVLRFYSSKNYTGPQLELKVSTDYNGGGDPYTATWTILTDQVIWSNGAFAWTESGAISLSQFSGNTVHVAFQFFSTTTGSANWELDNVEVTQEALVGEPSNYPGSFMATAENQTITLTWDDASGDVLPEAYLIKADNQNAIQVPVDGTPVANDANLADGTGAMNIEFGVGTYTFSGLEENTSYYFQIFPYTNTGTLINYKTDGTAPAANATTEENPYIDLLVTTFDDNWQDWEQISITGVQIWDRENTYGIEGTPCARMSGYSGGSFENEDWLISPDIIVSGLWYEEQLIFNSAKAYTGLPLEVKISTDYTGNPSTATWTDLSDQAVWPEDGSFFVWTNSGIIDISNWSSDKINIAFVYQSDETQSTTWEVDNISVQAMLAEGVGELNHSAVNIYPNPGKGIFNIESETPINFVEVYAITGALMVRQNMDELSGRIDLSELNQGIYFARITDNEGNIITNKIIIE